MDPTNIVGFAASAVSFLIFIPGAIKVWTLRNDPHALIGVSLLMHGLVLLNATLWGVYAVLTQAFWVGAPGLVNGPLSVITIILVLRSRRALAVTVPRDVS